MISIFFFFRLAWNIVQRGKHQSTPWLCNALYPGWGERCRILPFGWIIPFFPGSLGMLGAAVSRDWGVVIWHWEAVFQVLDGLTSHGNTDQFGRQAWRSFIPTRMCGCVGVFVCVSSLCVCDMKCIWPCLIEHCSCTGEMETGGGGGGVGGQTSCRFFNKKGFLMGKIWQWRCPCVFLSAMVPFCSCCGKSN